MRRTLTKVAKVAPSDSTVLILGETGTGKELIARAIHRLSNRSARAFIRVNCAAIPASLIVSELFGYEEGAFTGAVQRRIGRFESADGGTIFLDEIGDLPAETQIALLRGGNLRGMVAASTGLGSCKLTLETVGPIALTATYGGDGNNNGGTSAGFAQTVN